MKIPVVEQNTFYWKKFDAIKNDYCSFTFTKKWENHWFQTIFVRKLVVYKKASCYAMIT